MANTISARDDAWRSIDIDKYDPDSAVNFNMAAFTPGIEPVSAGEVQSLIGQIRVPLRTGNAAAALRQALENVPYGADEKSKEAYLAVVLEILQATRQADVLTTLTDLYSTNVELLDVLMKYLYRGMSLSSSTSSSSVPATQTPSSTGSSALPSAFSGAPGAGGRNFHSETGGQIMSVLLSWHEKAVEVAGLGCVSRVMTDRRTV